jgi:phosphatidylglycerophosphatase A
MRPTARKMLILLASGAGVGFLPVMPGTFGTLAAVPISLAINRLGLINPLLAAGALIALIGAAIVIADKACETLGAKDPQIVVIDEIAGFALANFLTETSGAAIAAFGLFRLFDIAKLFPARRLEQLPGGAGIVLDDLLAGLYTLAIVTALSWVRLV